MAILRVKVGAEKGKIYEIKEDSLVLGRDAAGDIQFMDNGVSRRHSEIFRIGELFFIRDLESRNGTFVNEKRVTEELLRVGDQVRVGSTTLVFEDRLTFDSSRIMSNDPQPIASPTSTIQLSISKVLPSKRDGEKKDEAEGRNLHLLLHLAQTISGEKNLSKLFGKVSELLGKSMGADHVYVLGLAKPAAPSGDFELLGRYHKEGDTDVVAGVSRGIVRECLEQNRSVLTSDASLDQRFNPMASVVLNQLRSVICVPICVLGKSLGVIYVYSNRAEAFTADDLEVASAAGIQLGATIELLKLVRRSDRFFRNSIKTLVSAIEMRFPKNKGASSRVATYCLGIAKELGYSTQEARDVWLAGMLHDIGSIPMSDTERENQVTSLTKKNHFARELLRSVPGLERILPAIEQCHERHDGTGAPEGIQGDQIDPLARVLGIALELDRLLTEKAGEGADMSLKEVLLKVREMADKQFDRQTVNALLIAYRNGKLFNQEEEFFEVPSE
jgi:HD-GYP domain-containing protein (c-di-GMP phosphodiesterase class II)/pSer/pThr/pTyr-binding forkhead associated (FHA) protein